MLQKEQEQEKQQLNVKGGWTIMANCTYYGRFDYSLTSFEVKQFIK